MISHSTFLLEIRDFFKFIFSYIKSRVIAFGQRFEKIKDIIVSFLIVKRGKYSQSFLNTSFFLLIGAAIIVGPVIAENNPFIASYLAQGEGAQQGSVLATDVYSLPFDTQYSVKPRDKVEDYTVQGGDTLASIAKRFDISVDTIKWANDLDNDTINPGDTLKIPPVTGVVHKVETGETIYSIAKKYKVDAQAILNFPFNDFADLDTFALTTGQNLVVPNGVIEKAQAIYQPQYVGQTPQIYTPPPGSTGGSGSFIWPTQGIITQWPVWYHMAFDIANNALPPIWASDSGTVVFSGCIGYGYGCHIIIDHNNGYQTLYGHMSQLGVSVGQSVSRGQVIGRMGSTGNSTGPHLHFEVRQGGRQLDPSQFVHP